MLKFWKSNFRKEMKFANAVSTSCSPGNKNGNVRRTWDSFSEDVVQTFTVQECDCAVLTCNVNEASTDVRWTRKDDVGLLRGDVSIRHDNGTSTLTVKDVRFEDGGTYLCHCISDNGQPLSVPVVLRVVGKPSAPSKPRIIEHCGTCLRLQWDPPTNSGNLPIDAYTIEFFERGIDVWQVVIAFCPNCSQLIHDLTPGKAYKFRISANNRVGISEPGESSETIEIPYIDSRQTFEIEGTALFWKTGFEKDFSEVSELGRGRFAVVKRCVQKNPTIESNKNQAILYEVAAKMIYKKRANVELAQNEFLMMQSLQHPALVHALDTYQSASAYILVHQIVHGKRLFEHICEKPYYDENDVRSFMRQFLDVVQYLHNCRICHLDLKPENLLVDLSRIAAQLKLVDFGDARLLLAADNLYVHPLIGSPEFSAPELVLGRPISLLTDMWSVGVILYAFLSGVSPYLDDSMEETALNIVQNDYSFPDEYFASISSEARALIVGLLASEKERRWSAQTCLGSAWVREENAAKVKIPTARLTIFIERRRHQVYIV